MVDLHLHSTFSDGIETPERLAALGREAGLSALALTDHDTLEGTRRFQAAAAAHGIRTVTGVEISVESPGREVHVLGYGVDPEHGDLRRSLGDLREGRHARNLRILAKLRDLGCPLDYEALRRLAGDDGVIGRPHLAQALIEAGHARNKPEAFARFLGRGAPAYCDRLRLGPARALALIHAAGGVAVLAHPHLLGLQREDLRRFVRQLRQDGLDGIEAYHSEQPANVTAALLQLAADLGLLVTGGSDFHGATQLNFRVGFGFGGLRVPDDCFARLAERLAAPAPVGQAGPANARTAPRATTE